MKELFGDIHNRSQEAYTGKDYDDLYTGLLVSREEYNHKTRATQSTFNTSPFISRTQRSLLQVASHFRRSLQRMYKVKAYTTG
jgi:hypothetical protein